MVFPAWFISIGTFQLKTLIVPLLQIIMFGMGTTMGWNDFANVIRMPGAVAIGLVCQFTIMPGIGFFLAHVMDFPPEIAAGIILIGCSPSGLASNVMAFIAKANVPLSITITSCATLLAPLLTPTLMGWLGGAFIEVNVLAMVWDIVKMVIIPVALGLTVNRFFPGVVKTLSFMLPLISMAGIAVIITIITAAGRDALMAVGFTLVIAVVMHNLIGFVLGYFAAKLAGLKEQDCRTVSIEVGLQNGGLASGLALQMGKVATVGLAPALFGPLMNITGSMLASWWGRHPPAEMWKSNRQ